MWRHAAFLAVLVVTVVAGCSTPSSPTPAGPVPSGPMSAPVTPAGPASSGPPSGSASPAPPGAWQVLFDGTAPPAFRGYGQAAFPDGSWRVEGSELHAVPGKPVDLITLEPFGDFELEFEWRVGGAGNSGVIYRVVESADPAWASGPEYQVLDDLGHPDGSRAETSAAALYDLLAPESKELAPVGAWNAGRVVVDDGAVEHWLNGTRVVVYEWRGPDIVARIAASKFRDLPAFMRADAGAIVLQHHGEAATYRNVRVRRL